MGSLAFNFSFTFNILHFNSNVTAFKILTPLL